MKISCDDATDCTNGNVCCALVDQNTGIGSVECRPSCKGQSNIRAGILCNPNAQVDQCANISNTSCQESFMLPGYFVCRN